MNLRLHHERREHSLEHMRKVLGGFAKRLTHPLQFWGQDRRSSRMVLQRRARPLQIQPPARPKPVFQVHLLSFACEA